MNNQLKNLQEEGREEWKKSKACERVQATDHFAQLHGWTPFEGEIIPDIIDSLIEKAYQAGKLEGFEDGLEMARRHLKERLETSSNGGLRSSIKGYIDLLGRNTLQPTSQKEITN